MTLTSKHPDITDSQICIALGIPLHIKYYYQNRAKKLVQEGKDPSLGDPYQKFEPMIIKCFNEHNGTYGCVRLSRALKDDYGIELGVSTVNKLMRRLNLYSNSYKKSDQG